MARFIEGEDRRQVALLPECLDDYVGENSSVRVIDAFVDELDLGALGFDRVRAASTGRPGYHAGAMLKLSPSAGAPLISTCSLLSMGMAAPLVYGRPITGAAGVALVSMMS